MFYFVGFAGAGRVVVAAGALLVYYVPIWGFAGVI